MQVECAQCGKVFNKPPSHIRRAKRVFCDKECFDVFQREKSLRDGKSRMVPCKVCGNLFRVVSCYASRYSTCSDRCLRKSRQDSSNPNWRGGLTEGLRKKAMSRREYKAWRTAVLERDGYRCVRCGIMDVVLCADHIKSWAYHPELRYAVENGRTLCVTCHRLTYYSNVKRTLSDEQAQEIIEKSRGGATANDLAKEYGISTSMVYRIRGGKAYIHATYVLLGKPLNRVLL